MWVSLKNEPPKSSERFVLVYIGLFHLFSIPLLQPGEPHQAYRRQTTSVPLYLLLMFAGKLGTLGVLHFKYPQVWSPNFPWQLNPVWISGWSTAFEANGFPNDFSTDSAGGSNESCAFFWWLGFEQKSLGRFNRKPLGIPNSEDETTKGLWFTRTSSNYEELRAVLQEKKQMQRQELVQLLSFRFAQLGVKNSEGCFFGGFFGSTNILGPWSKDIQGMTCPTESSSDPSWSIQISRVLGAHSLA